MSDKENSIIDRLDGNVTISVQNFIDLVNSASANDAELEERYKKQIDVILNNYNELREDFRYLIDVFEGIIKSTSEIEIQVGHLIGDVLDNIITPPIEIITPEKTIRLGIIVNNEKRKVIELK